MVGRGSVVLAVILTYYMDVRFHFVWPTTQQHPHAKKGAYIMYVHLYNKDYCHIAGTS